MKLKDSSPTACRLLQSFFIDDKRVSPNLIHHGLKELFETHGNVDMQLWSSRTIDKDPFNQIQYGGDEALLYLLQLFASLGNADLSFLNSRSKLTTKCTECQTINAEERRDNIWWGLDTNHIVALDQDLSNFNATSRVPCSTCDATTTESVELRIEHIPSSDTQVLLINTYRTTGYLHRRIWVPEALGGFRLHGVLDWIGDDIDSGHYSVYVSANPPQTEGPRSSSRSNTPSWYEINMEVFSKCPRYKPTESNTSASMLVYVKDVSLDASRTDVQTEQHANTPGKSNSKVDHFTLRNINRIDHQIRNNSLHSRAEEFCGPEFYAVWQTIYPENSQYLKNSNCGCRRKDNCCNGGKL
jgi:hypothetical protein